jgi:hypothetical protein
MSDFYLDWGDDLQAAPDGDFALASGDVLMRQDVVRAIATNEREVLDDGVILDAENLFAPHDWGSIGREVGQTVAASGSDLTPIEERVRKAIATVQSVSQTQRPTIQIRVVDGGVRLLIAVVSAATNQPMQIALFIPT